MVIVYKEHTPGWSMVGISKNHKKLTDENIQSIVEDFMDNFPVQRYKITEEIDYMSDYLVVAEKYVHIDRNEDGNLEIKVIN